jgi:hypothetical protein
MKSRRRKLLWRHKKSLLTRKKISYQKLTEKNNNFSKQEENIWDVLDSKFLDINISGTDASSDSFVFMQGLKT